MGQARLPTAEIFIDNKSAIIPDVTRISLDSFGTLPNTEQGVADVISLSDLSRIIDLRDMTLGIAIQDWDSRRKEALSLEDYPFVSKLTISEIADLTNLYDVEVGELAIAETALATFLRHPVLAIEKKLTLAQVLDRYPGMGDFKLGFLELSEYGYKDVPNFLSIPITAIPDWGQIKPSEIVGLREMVLHQEVKVDGEIVTLKTVPENGRVKISLEDKTGLSMEWKEEIEQGLTPFNSYSLIPTLAGERITVAAYFSICEKNDCQLVGPFPYGEYRKGDAIYVSAKDWSSAERTSKPTVKFSRQPSVTTADVVTPEIPIYKSTEFQLAIAGTLIVMTISVLTIYRLLSNISKNS